LLTFRRVVAPLRDVLARIVHVDKSVLGEDLDVEFRDLYDHVLRVYDELDTQRDLLTGILEAHLSVVSNRLNDVVLKLSSWAGVALAVRLRLGAGPDGDVQCGAVVALPALRLALAPVMPSQPRNGCRTAPITTSGSEPASAPVRPL
jgi:hypothetical protein